MLSGIWAASTLGACDTPGECNGDYHDYNRGDRCQFQIPSSPAGLLELSPDVVQLTPAQSDTPASATLLVTGKAYGAAADGYIVDVAINGSNEACSSAFELSPASAADVCTGVSPAQMHCVFNALGQLHVTVSTRSTRPLDGCLIQATSGTADEEEQQEKQGQPRATTTLEIVYPLESLTLTARTPAALGPCDDAAAPCELPPVTARAYCGQAPACEETRQQTQLYFATERGGQQIGSGHAIDVLLTALPQTDHAGPLSFSSGECTNGEDRIHTSIDAHRGESEPVSVCADGRGGGFELRGTAVSGVVLTDSAFVEFPAQPPSVEGKLSADKASYEVLVRACDGTGIAGASIQLELEGDTLENHSLMTDGAGVATVPTAVTSGTATVKLDAWDTSCIYPVG